MKVDQLFRYCLKSCRGESLSTVAFNPTGFLNDRTVAIIDSDNRIITGREYPELLGISSNIKDRQFVLRLKKSKEYFFPLPDPSEEHIEIKLFRHTVAGRAFSKEANAMLSQLLQAPFRFVHVGNSFRPLSVQRGGKQGEATGYADSAPVHLINLETLEYLNSNLKESVTVRHFRPNIVIEGVEPFEEDSWSLIEINGFRFRLQEKTQRCIFTTIDPKTHVKNKNLQPLANIAKIRAKSNLRPTFGIGLVPLGKGNLNIGDTIKVIKMR